MLYLSRNLHFEVHQVLHLPRTLHFEVHQVLHLPRNLHLEVHQVLCLPRNLHVEVHQALCLPRNLYFEVHQVLCLPRNLQTSHMPRFTAPVTKSELLDDVQSAAPATKTTFRSKTAPIPCTCHEKSLENFWPGSLAPATKSHHHVRKCARHYNESAVVRSTRRRHPDSASLRSRSAHGRCREA